MSIGSGVIRAQTPKLSEIARNFFMFVVLPNFVGAPLPKVVHILSRVRRATPLGKVS